MPMMNRLYTLSLACLTIAIGYLFVRSATAQTPRRPYTITRQEVSLDKTGRPWNVGIQIYAQRADGSQAKVRSILRPDRSAAVMQRTITDLTLGHEIFADGLTETTTTLRMQPEAIENVRAIRPCSVDPSPRRSKILGYDVVERVVEIKAPSRFTRVVQWVALDLNCFPLREEAFAGSSDSDLIRIGMNEATRVELGEPKPVLFEVPASYKERAPSARRAEYFRRFPDSPCPSCLAATDRTLDTQYKERGVK